MGETRNPARLPRSSGATMSSQPSTAAFSVLALAALFLGAPASAQDATAAPPTTAAPTACGFKMDEAAMKLWTAFNGEAGPLGCPTSDQVDAAPSAKGVRSDELAFGARGAIFVYRSGTKAGQAVAITNCYPLYFQYGGPSGWLGLPLDNAANTPDGQVQRFEGGEMRLGRALQTCDATASPGDS